MPQSVVVKDDDGNVVLELNNDGSINSVLKDKAGLSVEFDTAASSTPSVYGYLVSMDIPHHKIHEQTHYFWSDYDADVDISAPKYWRLTTPATGRVHLTWSIQMSLNGRLEIYENPTISGAGTAKAAYNSDRNSSTASTVLHYYDTTTSADGALLKTICLGSDGTNPVGRQGATNTHSTEIILKANEDYIFKCISKTDNSRVSLNLEYYIVPT